MAEDNVSHVIFIQLSRFTINVQLSIWSKKFHLNRVKWIIIIFKKCEYFFQRRGPMHSYLLLTYKHGHKHKTFNRDAAWYVASKRHRPRLVVTNYVIHLKTLFKINDVKLFLDIRGVWPRGGRVTLPDYNIGPLLFTAGPALTRHCAGVLYVAARAVLIV